MKKKVLALTGGSRGIGRGIADHFHEKGFSVSICSRSADPADFPREFFVKQVDVRIQSEVKSYIGEVIEHFGGLDVMVNCAGISQWRPLSEIDETFMKNIYETNVLGTLWGCQAAAPFLKPGGSIVNVSSLAGKRGSANNSAYCASKFAVNGITQALAKELGPKKIRVNSVCPVYVETQEILKSLEDPRSPAQGKPVDVYLKEFTQTQTALLQLPTAKNVAETVHFLGTSQSGAITGQCINVDCGTLPQ